MSNRCSRRHRAGYPQPRSRCRRPGAGAYRAWARPASSSSIFLFWSTELSSASATSTCLCQDAVEGRCRRVAHLPVLAVQKPDDLGKGVRCPAAVLEQHDPLFLGQEPRGHLRPVRVGRGGLQVHDLFFGLAQVVAGFGEDALQEMPVLSERLRARGSASGPRA